MGCVTMCERWIACLRSLIMDFLSAGAWRQGGVGLTSMLRDDVVSTPVRRHFGVICSLGMSYNFVKHIYSWRQGLVISGLSQTSCPSKVYSHDATHLSSQGR